MLTAIGTENDSIYFTCDTLINPDRWHSLRFESAYDSSQLSYCVFEYGKALGEHPTMYGMGGAVYTQNCNLSISNCYFRYNSAQKGGGALYCHHSNAIITGCYFYSNSGGVGGAFASFEADPTISNCIFVENEANSAGAMWLWNNSPQINNCTMTLNYAVNTGGAIQTASYAYPTITNCILWNNNPEEINQDNGNPTVTYCDVEGGWPGTGNIDCDPMFCDPESGNFYLSDTSCCVGAGEDSVDIGALGIGCGLGYEYLPGDANMSVGQWPPQVIGGDVTYLVNYFRGLSNACLLGGFYCSGDVNADCQVIGSDVTRMVTYFRGLVDIIPCPDYEPAWPTPDDLPTEAPDGWPNCETPEITVKAIPADTGK
jgi:predicted outer membrane repeat protein